MIRIRGVIGQGSGGGVPSMHDILGWTGVARRESQHEVIAR